MDLLTRHQGTFLLWAPGAVHRTRPGRDRAVESEQLPGLHRRAAGGGRSPPTDTEHRAASASCRSSSGATSSSWRGTRRVSRRRLEHALAGILHRYLLRPRRGRRARCRPTGCRDRRAAQHPARRRDGPAPTGDRARCRHRAAHPAGGRRPLPRQRLPRNQPHRYRRDRRGQPRQRVHLLGRPGRAVRAPWPRTPSAAVEVRVGGARRRPADAGRAGRLAGRLGVDARRARRRCSTCGPTRSTARPSPS